MEQILRESGFEAGNRLRRWLLQKLARLQERRMLLPLRHIYMTALETIESITQFDVHFAIPGKADKQRTPARRLRITFDGFDVPVWLPKAAGESRNPSEDLLDCEDIWA
eukprot:SAG31_NODE_9943_length_1207_cov_1.285199_1_plen_109_part_00